MSTTTMRIATLSCLAVLLVAMSLLAVAAASSDPPSPPPTPVDLSGIPNGIPGGVPAVTLVYPKANDTINMNVTYSQSSGTAANCSVWIDGEDMRRYRTGLPSGETQIETFRSFEEGQYAVGVNCTNGTWAGSAARTVTLSDAPEAGGLKVSPDEVFTYETVYFSGEFVPQTVVNVSITNPAGAVIMRNYTVRLSGSLKANYTVPGDARNGTYKVKAYSLDEKGKMIASSLLQGDFIVLLREPTLSIDGGKPNISQGRSFRVTGTDFLADDMVDIAITGAGKTVTALTGTGRNSRDFDYTVNGSLAVGSYTLTATSRSQTSITDSISFNIIAASIAPTTIPVVGTTPVVTPTPTPTTDPVTGFETPDTGTIPDFGDSSPQPMPDETFTFPSESGLDEPVEPSRAWLWWLIGGVLLLVLLGTLGFMIYTGQLDVEQYGIQLPEWAHQHKAAPAAPPLGAAEAQSVKAFITRERAKGFDDLTIRGALVQKGWSKEQVDHVFDDVYKGG